MNKSELVAIMAEKASLSKKDAEGALNAFVDAVKDAGAQTAIVTGNNTSIRFSIDNVTTTIDGAAKTMDVPARLINDKTLVPLRFLSEELGFDVEWDEAERLVTISK